MPERSLASMLMQITDGHPASAAEAVRRPAEIDRYNTAERVVLVALLRHAREKSLKSRVLGDAAACASSASASNYALPPRETAENHRRPGHTV